MILGLKVFGSWLAGFTIASLVVFILGTIMSVRPSRRASYIYYLCTQVKDKGFDFSQGPLKDVEEKVFWLCAAQNEVDFLPLILCLSAIGPVIILARQKRGLN